MAEDRALLVTFASAELEKCYTDGIRAVRRWGETVSRKYVLRVSALEAADDLRDIVAHRAFRVHPLKGTLAGHYSLSLNERWRLIFSYDAGARSIVIEEVSNHYGD